MSEVVRQRLAALAQAPAESDDGVDEGTADDDIAEPPPPARRGVESIPSATPTALGRAWQFTREHLVAVAIVLLVGVVSTVWATTQARTIPVAEATAIRVSDASPSPTPTTSPIAEIQVHVLGAVATPGVVTLPEGARIHDAIAAAGGLRSQAKPGDLNLAAVVADGAQIAIGTADASVSDVTRVESGGAQAGASAGGGAGGLGGAGGTVGTGAKLDLNSATAEQLDTLPGVGPVTASKILAWRDANGRFSSVDELTEIDGIGPKTFARLAELVSVG